MSDFAFLLVAPVLLTTLLPLRLPGRRLLAFATVVAVYAAADLSAAVSDAVVACAGRFGLHWRLWPDLADLLALAVLPASWRIAGVHGNLSLRPPRAVVQGAGLVIGVFACLATSENLGYEHQTAGSSPARPTRNGSTEDSRAAALGPASCMVPAP